MSRGAAVAACGAQAESQRTGWEPCVAIHFSKLGGELGIDFRAVIKIVSERGMYLRGKEVRVLADDFLGRPAVTQVVGNNLRNPHARQSPQSGNLAVGFANVRITKRLHWWTIAHA
jgi:hypothetical protein